MSRLRTGLAPVLIAATLLVAACGDDETPEAAAGNGGAEGAWTYTDGSGETTTLDEVPTRIVAHASAAAALMSFGIEPIGIFADTAVDEDLALQEFDLDGIEIVGEEWAVINAEAVAALEPDLIVSEWWPVEEGYTGMEDGTNLDILSEIAPVVGPAQGPSIVDMIEDYEQLAESLGADLDDPDIAAHRERFDGAVAAFEEAVAAKPGLSVLAVSPSEEGLYVAVPEYSAELSDFAEWGLGLVVPEQPDAGFEYWETLSWENADKYQADLIILDERSYPGSLELAKDQPTWTALAAAEAEATAVWPAYWVRTYDAYAAALDELTAAVDAADENLVP